MTYWGFNFRKKFFNCEKVVFHDLCEKKKSKDYNSKLFDFINFEIQIWLRYEKMLSNYDEMLTVRHSAENIQINEKIWFSGAMNKLKVSLQRYILKEWERNLIF